MRTFEFSDATSHKFWNIDHQGRKVTVTYGRIGSAGQTQVKEFGDEAAARKEHDKLVVEKTRKGYKETTPSAKAAPTSLREGLEQALVENPDELANHMAYADYLTEQGDPLGEFIRVQLALEDAGRPAGERKKLGQQEKKLLAQHQRAWLGDLAPFLLEDPLLDGEEEDEYERSIYSYTFRRGWLDTLRVSRPKVNFARALCRSPQARLVRSLEFADFTYEDTFEPGDDVPEDIHYPFFYALSRCEHLTNVRTLLVGEMISPKEDDQYLDYGPSCHVAGDGVVGPIKRMPKLEELRLLAHRVDTKQLFALKTLYNLRILHVDHNHDYPLAQLAKNPSLANLTHLLLWPHAHEEQGEGDEKAYIQTAGVKAVVTSPALKSLTHLRVRCSDMGDRGIKEIIDSGILKRLKWLDLRHGCVTDKGAQALAARPEVRGLELDLSHNSLTDAGVKALQAAGVRLKALQQWQPTGDDWNDTQYLACGDVE